METMNLLSTLHFSFPFLLLLLALIFLGLIFLSRSPPSRTLNHHHLPPTPPSSLPFIGHLHLFNHPPLHQALHHLSQKYGPVLLLRLGSRPVVLVSSFSVAEECFTKNDIGLANRPKLMLGKYFGYNYTTVITSPYGDHWRNLRRICTVEMFSNHRLNTLVSIRRDEIKRMLQKLYGRALDGFVKVEVRPLLTELSFNIMMRMVAGKRYFGDDEIDDEESVEFRSIIKEIVKYGGASNVGDFLPPFMRWVGYTKGFEKKVAALCKKTDRFFQGLVDEKRRKMGDGTAESKNTFIDHLLTLQESQPEYYSDQIIKGLVLVMLLAGTDTTSVTLEWALSNLVNHPDILAKAKHEMDKHMEQDQRLIDETDIPKLHHLQNIVSETLRLKPAAPLLIPHLSSHECTVAGYNVPRNTIVLVNAWAIHRDPEIWDNPTRFDPDRFKQGGMQKLIMPFGLGRRACPGAPLALRVVSLALGSLIQCFDWKRVGDEDVDMSEGSGVTLLKVVPLVVMCKARPDPMHSLLM